MGVYRTIKIDGKWIQYSHYVWNINHPEDPYVPYQGYVIHHKDGNKKNDDPSNLQKVPDKIHRGIIHKANNLAQWHKDNPEKSKEVLRKGAKRMREVVKSDPVKYAKMLKKRRESVIKANKARKLPKEEWNKRRAAYMRKWRKRKGELNE